MCCRVAVLFCCFVVLWLCCYDGACICSCYVSVVCTGVVLLLLCFVLLCLLSCCFVVLDHRGVVESVVDACAVCLCCFVAGLLLLFSCFVFAFVVLLFGF